MTLSMIVVLTVVFSLEFYHASSFIHECNTQLRPPSVRHMLVFCQNGFHQLTVPLTLPHK